MDGWATKRLPLGFGFSDSNTLLFSNSTLDLINILLLFAFLLTIWLLSITNSLHVFGTTERWLLNWFFTTFIATTRMLFRLFITERNIFSRRRSKLRPYVFSTLIFLFFSDDWAVFSTLRSKKTSQFYFSIRKNLWNHIYLRWFYRIYVNIFKY